MPRFRRLRRLAARRLPIATKDQVREIQGDLADWALAHERLVAYVAGRRAGKPPARPPRHLPSPVSRREILDDRPASFEWLTAGSSLEDAAAAAARDVFGTSGAPAAQTFADRLLRDARGQDASALARGIVAHLRGFHALASECFAEADRDVVLRVAPLEYIGSSFLNDPAAALAEVGEWLDEAPSRLDAGSWFEIYKRVLALSELDVLGRVHGRLREAVESSGDELPTGLRREIEWLDQWEGADAQHVTAPRPDAGIPFAIMDYVQPGRRRMSQNIGDHVQTLASLGHVVRNQDVTFSGEADVVELLTELQGRVRPELRKKVGDAHVQVYRMHRDSSSLQAFPDGTWTLDFGWHMHDVAGAGVWDFPLHSSLRPIFVSFHCNKRELLTEEGLEYLRTYGPVGCRDWTTVDLLLSLDVPAFFSGCLTTTVSTVFPDGGPRPEAASTVYVDHSRSRVPDGAEVVRHSYPEVKSRSFVENMREAVRLLDWYRENFTRVVTSRLHCYLPSRSLGLDVTFAPKSDADVRFNGLAPLSGDEFDGMRQRIIGLLEPVLSAILRGESEEQVYATWRRVTAEHVDLAMARHRAPFELDEAGSSDASLIERLAQSVRTIAEPASFDPSEATDVVLLPDRADRARMGGVIRSVDQLAEGSVRCWIVSETAPAASALPPLERTSVRWVRSHGTVAEKLGARWETDPRLALLPELLPEVERAVVVSVDAMALTDLRELGGLPLEGKLLAARTTSDANSSGFGHFYRAARRLHRSPEAAFEFYRFVHGRHRFDFDAFGTDLLLLDLAAMRDAGATGVMLSYMRTYRLSAYEALLLLIGPHRVDLGREWGAVPTREVVTAPKLVCWPDSVVPSGQRYAEQLNAWRVALG